MTILMRMRVCFLLTLMMLVSVPGFGIAAGDDAPRLLDDFETLSSWHPIVSEGAKLSLSLQKDDRTGSSCMAMDFELVGVYGYVIAEKDVSIDVPENYEFTFDLKADIPVNNFEFKLIDEKENVFWIKKLNVEYPKNWQKQTIKKRHITFAWGPTKGAELRHVKKLQIVVSSGQGGRGRVLVDNLKFEALKDPSAIDARGTFSSSSAHAEARIDVKGGVLSDWQSGEKDSAWIVISYNYLKEIGGLMLEWNGTRFARRYAVELSDDGKEWMTAYEVKEGNGGRDWIYLPEKEGRALRLRFFESNDGTGYSLRRMEVKGSEFSLDANHFFSAMAQESAKGRFPKYFLNQASYWTIAGANADRKEALINEEGMIEVDKEAFSIEPFLLLDGKLVAWSDVECTQSLEDGYLPIPSVTWKQDSLTLRIRLLASGEAGRSLLIASYRLVNTRARALEGTLFLALRPFQVNPPWQWLNSLGGVSHLKTIEMGPDLIRADDRRVVPLARPDAFGAAIFDSGDITEYLARGRVPEAHSVSDPAGFASAAIGYRFRLAPGDSAEYHMAVPFHEATPLPHAAMEDGGRSFVKAAVDSTSRFWKRKLDRVGIRLPRSAMDVINTVKSNLAYILINRDSAGIQPGSRNYERSWIRDGSLTSTALLQLGIDKEVREYLDWYAGFQYPSGKIPCVVDRRGADPTPEHDSHGEFLYAIRTYFQYSRDTSWLRGKFDRVVKTVRYIHELRAERMTGRYRSGAKEEHALYGLLPESISHEGYSDMPRHSYWDDFFALRGLKDAEAMARALKEAAYAREFARERDEFRRDLYASMRLAMKNTKIDFIPGCAELGDFDATSTTIGIMPGGELGNIPEPALHNTFEKYYAYFSSRKNDAIAWTNYTPYENRVIGTFVMLGEKDRAQEAMRYFLHDRRPAAWNHWAEVVWRDPSTPKFIGDMPHTWVGSDFIRSIRAMFVYEREKDQSLVIGAGIPEAWLSDSAGVSVSALPTVYGRLSFTMTKKEHSAIVFVSGAELQMPEGGIILHSPLDRPVKAVRVDGGRLRAMHARSILVRSLPASVEFFY